MVYMTSFVMYTTVYTILGVLVYMTSVVRYYAVVYISASADDQKR